MGAGYFKTELETEFEYRDGKTYDPCQNRRTALTNVLPSCSTLERCIASKIRPLEQSCNFAWVLGSDESKRTDPVPMTQSVNESSQRHTFSKSCRTLCGRRQQQESWTEQDWNESGFNARSTYLVFEESSESDNFNSVSVAYLGSEKPQHKTKSSISWGSAFTETLSFQPQPITEVIPGKLYLGCEYNASNESELLELGITHILSVSNRINRIQGIEHEHFVMSDMGRTELETVLAEVYPFMKSAQRAEKKLFVHCKLGQNRSPTLVISFLIKNRGLTLYEAQKMLKERRPLIQIHRNYAKMLLRLERNILGETSLPDDWMEQDGFSLPDGIPRFKSEDLTPEEQQSFKTNQVETSTHSSTTSLSVENVYCHA